jgi:acyl-CoA reductase-like NAD-dependent aldehyde dehydrogenase
VQVASNAGEVRSACTPLRLASRRLRDMALTARAEVIHQAMQRLLDHASPLGRELRAELLRHTGLSREVIEHGLTSTLSLFEPNALLALHSSRRDTGNAELCVVVLAGNVFSAAARPLLLPLLCGSAVLAKASSADDVLPRCIERALCAVNPRLSAACTVVTFAHGDDALQRALLHDADVVSVYGSDETVAALRPRVPKHASFIAHGHGLGAIYLAAETLANEDAARALAKQAALDVAAYDQRGCLSPHAVWVQAGAKVDARDFAQLLLQALEQIEHVLPRGEVPAHAAAAQLQWRGVAAALFELHQGSSAAVSYEGAAPPRPTPGYRNISVHECRDTAALSARLAPLGVQLKALGVAGDAAARELAIVAPYVCPLGAMQTPPLDAELDGLHPLAGL